MKNRKKSKRQMAILLISLVSITALVLMIVVVLRENHIENKFPMWKEAERFPSNPDVKMEFVGIDFDVLQDIDEILVKVQNLSGEQMSFGAAYEVEYLHDDKWYTVFSPGAVPALSWTLGEEEITEKYQVVSGLFDEGGTYRLYVDGLGYCDIDILL